MVLYMTVYDIEIVELLEDKYVAVIGRSDQTSLLFTSPPHSSSADKFPAVTVISDYCWSDSLYGYCRYYSNY